MAHTFRTLQDSILHHIGDTSGKTREHCKRWLNDARNELWEIIDGEWKQATDYLATTESYTTGTCDATLGSTTVAGTSTVWTSAMAGRFMQINETDPWYRISSVTSGTELELEDAYIGDTDTDLEYDINMYLYPINSNVQRLVQVMIEDEIRWTEIPIAAAVDVYASLPVPLRWGTGGVPNVAWLDDPDSSGVYSMGIWYPPESASLVKYRYFKNPTDMSSDSDTVGIPGGDSWILLDATRAAFVFKNRMDAANQYLGLREAALDRLMATVGRARRVSFVRKDHTDAARSGTRVNLGAWYPGS